MSTRPLGDLAEQRLLFWTAFKTHLASSGSIIKTRAATHRSEMIHPTHLPQITLRSHASIRNWEDSEPTPMLRAELYLKGALAKPEFHSLLAQQDEIEAKLGFKLEWRDPKHVTMRQMCRMYIQREAEFRDRDLWPDQFDWLQQKLESLHRVFAPIVRSLRT